MIHDPWTGKGKARLVQNSTETFQLAKDNLYIHLTALPDRK